MPLPGGKTPDPPYHGIQTCDLCAKNRNSEKVGEVVPYNFFNHQYILKESTVWPLSSMKNFQLINLEYSQLLCQLCPHRTLIFRCAGYVIVRGDQ